MNYIRISLICLLALFIGNCGHIGYDPVDNTSDAGYTDGGTD